MTSLSHACRQAGARGASVAISVTILILISGCQFNKSNVKAVSSIPILTNDKLYFGGVDKNAYALDLNGKEVKKFENVGIIGTTPAISEDKIFVGSDDQNLYALNLSSGKLEWTFEGGGQVVSSTYYANSVVYFASDNFYAIDANTGKELWRYEEDTAVAPPAIVDGTIYFIGYTANVYAFDEKSGKLKWQIPTEDVVFTELPPVVVDNIVYVGADDLLALDAKTGKELWRFGVDGGVISTPNLVNGIIYFGTDKGKIYGVDVKTKKQTISFSTGKEIFSAPAVENGKLLFGSNQGKFYSYNASTGKKEFSVKLADVDPKFYERMRERTAEQTPSVENGLAFYVMVNDGTLDAVDISTGKIKWSL